MCLLRLSFSDERLAIFCGGKFVLPYSARLTGQDFFGYLPLSLCCAAGL